MAEQEALAWKEQQDYLSAGVFLMLRVSHTNHRECAEMANRDPIEGMTAVERHAQVYAEMQGDGVIDTALKKMGRRDIAETMMMQR